jgi:hypothetical protein
MPIRNYRRQVFINVPFDPDYRPIFDAVVFAVADCGYIPCCARERDDSGEIRFHKLLELIEQCRFGLHDISRTEPDRTSGLPRFNMPFELGLFLGAKRFGGVRQGEKIALILDVEDNRYDKFISDISGQDIKEHGGDPVAAVKAVRNWLANNTPQKLMPTGDVMAKRYTQFVADLPASCASFNMSRDEITFLDYRRLVGKWLQANLW